MSLHIGVTCDTTLEADSLASLNHATRNPSHAKTRSVLSRVWWALCTGATALPPAALPLRCKQHCVCHLQFRERPLCDRSRSVPVSACWLFFVPFQEMKKAVPSPSINKQLCE